MVTTARVSGLGRTRVRALMRLVMGLLGIWGASRLPAADLSGALTLNFRHVVDGKPLLMDSVRYEKTSGEVFSISRLSYIISGVSLETMEGGRVELEDQVAWVDLEKRRTMVTLHSIPRGVYRSARFSIGPDAEANHADVAGLAADHPLNPVLNNLHWSWQGGYIFLALEGRYRAGGETLSGFSYHFANDENRTAVTLAAPLDLNQSLACDIDFDIGTLLSAPRPLSFSGNGNSTHSRPGDEIAAALAKNIQSSFRVRRVYTSDPEITQSSALEPLYLPKDYKPYAFKMSRTFPIPSLPRDNPLLEERVALGERLFHESRLSRDDTISCATCHEPTLAFTDGRPVSIGIDGRSGVRNAMPLLNLAWKSSFFWDGRAETLREQALIPIEDHLEMDESLENVAAKLSADASYRAAFSGAFDSVEVTPERIGLAIENFLLTQTSHHSKFDEALSGNARFSESEQRGFELFMTEYEPRSQRFGADCFHCHGGPLFSDDQFHNNGLKGLGPADLGRFAVTRREADKGKFSTPSLRNVALTAPYMHDGRFSTLDEVVAHYDTGIERSATLDANLAKHPAAGLELSAQDRDDIVAFLKTLTDKRYLDTSSLKALAPE